MVQLSWYAFGVVELCYVPMSTECVLYQLGWRLPEQMFFRLLWLLLPALGKQCGAEQNGQIPESIHALCAPGFVLRTLDILRSMLG